MEKSGILEIVSKRRSPYAFAERKISVQELSSVMEAARYAPSSMNEQPWSFIIVEKGQNETYSSLIESLDEQNRVWAVTAPVLVISLAARNHNYRNKPNFYFMHDTGMAVASMILQAASIGISAHQMGGINREKIRQLFSVGEEYEVVAVIAMGYEGSDSELPERFRERWRSPRKRKELNEFVFRTVFGDPAF